MDEQWARDHIGTMPSVGGCGTSYHDERGDVQDCTSVEPCRACLRRRIEQLEARESQRAAERLPKDGDELQALLNKAYRKGNDDAHAAHAVMDGAQLEAQRGGSDLVELIRRRYPRMLERGNPLYDAVLADAVQRGGAIVVPEYPENSFDVRMAVQKAGGMADFDQGIFRAGWELLASRIQPISADRVLADGEISMARAEISAAFKAGFDFSKDWRNHPSNSEYVNELFRLRSAKGEV